MELVNCAIQIYDNLNVFLIFPNYYTLIGKVFFPSVARKTSFDICIFPLYYDTYPRVLVLECEYASLSLIWKQLTI